MYTVSQSAVSLVLAVEEMIGMFLHSVKRTKDPFFTLKHL